MLQVKKRCGLEDDATQRWVMGNRAPDDGFTLADAGIAEDGYTIFVYVRHTGVPTEDLAKALGCTTDTHIDKGARATGNQCHFFI